METKALIRRIVEISTDQNHGNEKKEFYIGICVRGHVTDALNLLDNIRTTSVNREDMEKREKELMDRFGISKSGNGQFI